MTYRIERLRGTLVPATLTDTYGGAHLGAPVGVLGGLSGAFSVTTALAALPRAGAMVVIAAARLGRSVASLAIAHFQSKRWLPSKGRSACARPSSEDPES